MNKKGEFEKFERIAVLGPGMIGASFSRAMKARGLAGHVTGCARNEKILKSSARKGYIDSYETDPASACIDADLVLFATPVETFASLAKEISGSLKKGALVIDAGSVKGSLAYNLEALMPDSVHYVPCHPIAGSEMSGPDASSPDLFEGACCILTPTENTDPGALESVAGLWEGLGARIEKMHPMHHDKVYALVSHFPHLVMFSLVNAVSDIDESALRFTGGGFDDSTRIAKSSPSLWKNIFMMNSANLIDCIDTLVSGLEGMRSALSSGDGKTIKSTLERAQKARIGIKGGR
ncbi:MAG: prephenate dehydrogenase/arogenate dehydrogenase family protein [Thermodesulfovibrionales bacterium]|nr:prephenate dehydrogenase/arogenate dehydrogenase family protein [Thermodesulfovibrionales bacterium]